MVLVWTLLTTHKTQKNLRFEACMNNRRRLEKCISRQHSSALQKSLATTSFWSGVNVSSSNNASLAGHTCAQAAQAHGALQVAAFITRPHSRLEGLQQAFPDMCHDRMQAEMGHVKSRLVQSCHVASTPLAPNYPRSATGLWVLEEVEGYAPSSAHTLATQ